ncbi:MAG: hypothetical protein ISS95_00280 [Candidatus Aenigmarchaeota archaeon]|nr:hypothetical protein [Candidatus Aenigmarchaeota archaeon]
MGANKEPSKALPGGVEKCRDEIRIINSFNYLRSLVSECLDNGYKFFGEGNYREALECFKEAEKYAENYQGSDSEITELTRNHFISIIKKQEEKYRKKFDL